MAAPQNKHNLPVLFQFSQPNHNVAVFRGADLKKAIASGLVKGFGTLGSTGGDDEERDGRSEDSGNSQYGDTDKAAADAKAAAEAQAFANSKAGAEELGS